MVMVSAMKFVLTTAEQEKPLVESEWGNELVKQDVVHLTIGNGLYKLEGRG